MDVLSAVDRRFLCNTHINDNNIDDYKIVIDLNVKKGYRNSI